MYKKVNNPLVSVVLPVYNAGAYLREAILSIIGQTYTNWELIIVDDGSTDDSWQIAQELANQDSRLRLFRNRSHRGVTYAANLAIKHARGKYLARMDGDDISHSSRLARQLAFLQKNPQVVAVGAQCTLINAQGKKIGEKNFPLTSQTVYEQLFYNLPLQQPSIMINRQLLPKDFIWYHQPVVSGEEHQLVFRLFQFGQVVNLPSFLLKYRLHGQNTSMQHPKKDFYQILYARFFAVMKWGYRPSIRGWFLCLTQLLVVSVLPGKYLFPLFYWLRNLHKQLSSWRVAIPVAVSSSKINI